MSDSQDNLLDFEYDIQGADLLDQSADLGGEPKEEEVLMLEEVQVLPPEPAEQLSWRTRATWCLWREGHL